MFYELTKLSVPPLELDNASARAWRWVKAPEAGGRILGFWRTEIGELFQLLVLRGFDQLEALQRERERAQLSHTPFNLAGQAVGISMESYRPFPFLPPAPSQVEEPGAFYEIRTYRLKPGGLGPTLAGWEKALPPARAYSSHLITNMYALDGPPRITHIWKFASLEERGRLRAEHYAAGLWPPQGGPRQIAGATSFICLAEKDPADGA
ncbi:NIPSNAP family protein [Acerihabitans arboris]|uniref:NIPSNAP family protein n=1 Tax=Acerihabitans arboris TaxID=2691583 RepID=A0A845SFN5_9GAMM|nr:NIPSNAP family protein [Acerihabitans arboris]NDL62157.1 NIPSNAP family protein [Acerihabitans arboris]